MIAAHDDAARARDALKKIPQRLAGLDLQPLKRCRVQTADGLDSDPERRGGPARRLLEGLPVEVAVLVEDAAARRIPCDANTLQHDAVAARVVSGLAHGDHASYGQLTAKIDRAFVARLELQPAPELGDRIALDCREAKDRPPIRPAVLHIYRLPVVEPATAHDDGGDFLWLDGHSLCRQGSTGSTHEGGMHDLVLLAQLVASTRIVIETMRGEQCRHGVRELKREHARQWPGCLDQIV